MNSGYILAFLIVLLGTGIAVYATRNLLNANKNRKASRWWAQKRRWHQVFQDFRISLILALLRKAESRQSEILKSWYIFAP
ncbi:MAG: hypothetical protein R3B47_11285 [Bacteroidia bacterium]